MKIFISHSSLDNRLVNPLMDLIQTQFGLTRSNFFNTSDEELQAGGQWIEEIKQGMHDSSLVLPVITPNYLESAFCLCELGATWVKSADLIPIIVPPLDYKALNATPFRSVYQTVSLDSEEGLTRLYDAITKRGIGQGNVTRFLSRAKQFSERDLAPFIKEMEQREVVTPALVKNLKADVARYKEAFESSESEMDQLREENKKLRLMKDAKEVKQMDYERMDEWDEFMAAAEEAKSILNSLPRYAVSVLYQNYKSNHEGFFPESDDFSKLTDMESEGMVIYDSGWKPDYGHPKIKKADAALDKLKAVCGNYPHLEERFHEEYPDCRFGLRYSNFWEAIFKISIYKTN
ncbi:toll/interleukin-1 receptor domain-containing protein [Cohnella phaseoli]|uniref:TIR domain-containing protein n=1 Tax=Cohnella phaseoli TaxID=456490 RepID=A0A3D9JQF8_9BACL|nr:toll/interleukin-1 receptor domain-containing protein [Cohnella phaseoli]RED76029.1 TIR domain-containing protein [Cohnella phaseoli]